MNLRRRLRTLFRRRDAEAEMAEEMRFHLEQRAADYAADGLAAEDARLAAQRRFGNLASIQEQARETRGWGWLERFGKDLQFAARQLVRSPGFTLLAVVTLGLGIGANTSMFSVYSSIALKPLPYSDLPRLQRINRISPQDSEGNISPADFLALQQAAAPYGEVAALHTARLNLSDPGRQAELAVGARASVNLFATLGVRMQHGRDFQPGEDAPGRAHLVILSDRVWRHRYGAATDIVGRTIRVDGQPHTVIGVLPTQFNDWRHLGWIDFFRPFEITPDFAADHLSCTLEVLGHPNPGLTLPDAAAWLAAFGASRARDFPEANSVTSWKASALQSTVVRGSGGETTLGLLLGLSGFVLLIACSNLANLLLTRTLARAREFAVRGALGASRLQLIRPLAAESLILSLLGGIFALLLSLWFRDWIAARSTGDNGEQVWVSLDWTVLIWTLGSCCATALVFGLAPALFALRLDLNATLKSGGHGALAGRRPQRIRALLVVGQFALATVLLVGAGVFIRGLDDLRHRRAGWQSTQVITGTINLSEGAYRDDGKIVAFQRRALERLRTLPGVQSATLASAAPFFSWPHVVKFQTANGEQPAAGHEPTAMLVCASPGYLETFSMRLLAGRGFLDRDVASAPPVFLIGESTARAIFGLTDPIGQRLALLQGATPVWGEIVGVVADFETVDAEANPIAHRLYRPLAQVPTRSFELAVRSASGLAPSALADPIKTALAELDGDLPIRHLQPADATIDRRIYQLGVMRDLLTTFGLLGLALASLGIYGVISRTAAMRAKEFATRLALGATSRDLARLVLGSGAALSLAGAIIGLLGGAAISRLLLATFPGIHANTSLILAGTTVLLVAVALIACWLPARRASHINPIDALRAD